ncbi:hypothetical protein CTAM01_05903 [Colletotrichum tamarilloi]|uniref:Uncharacterized protein n=1 Tax=Colletotrichum tamarilloi TaxID=1209934 RepID=A0ABQ9RDX5_9PEZI|nr:uncharacterized protein CTAM01_05903 [Colletotrichum tamarilloi]KAI3537816.1 hypothetical protein CSPX01_09986 [Colletotrichum filicis]KAK1501679.1 hypothetical protein CTAM01_05903 [Colletotrichum tamarilloi]
MQICQRLATLPRLQNQPARKKNMCLPNRARRCQLRPSFRRTVLVPLTGQNPDRSWRKICSACLLSSYLPAARLSWSSRKSCGEDLQKERILKTDSIVTVSLVNVERECQPRQNLRIRVPENVPRLRLFGCSYGKERGREKKTGFGRQHGILLRQAKVGSNAVCGEAGTPKTCSMSALARGKVSKSSNRPRCLPRTQPHVP